ncbi:MAG TPA: hypothetical protein VFV80_13695 [Geminicoccaceae bacterium]|nr:hypothetical protein [Geminicoccaceae bacterium]
MHASFARRWSLLSGSIVARELAMVVLLILVSGIAPWLPALIGR